MRQRRSFRPKHSDRDPVRFNRDPALGHDDSFGTLRQLHGSLTLQPIARQGPVVILSCHVSALEAKMCNQILTLTCATERIQPLFRCVPRQSIRITSNQRGTRSSLTQLSWIGFKAHGGYGSKGPPKYTYPAEGMRGGGRLS